MTDPYLYNEEYLLLIELLCGELRDLTAAEEAFLETHGGFAERFRAAVVTQIKPLLRPEKFIEIPENPDALRVRELDALVRPVASGFLRSQPSKAELVDQVHSIAYGQANRPEWMPRTEDSVPAPKAEEPESWYAATTLTGFLELGPVRIEVPAPYADDPLLDVAAPDGAQLQMALMGVLRAADDDAAGRYVRYDSDALDALAPLEHPWWVPADVTLPVRSAAEDPAVAMETVATAATLGGIAVHDLTEVDAVKHAGNVLLSAGPWVHGARIEVDTWDLLEAGPMRSIARASFAGWADATNTGFVVAITGGGWVNGEGVGPDGSRMHAALLWWTAPDSRSPNNAGTLHRVVTYCPGELICPHGGCAVDDSVELAALLGFVTADASVAAAVAGSFDWARDSYRDLLCGNDVDVDALLEVLGRVTKPLPDEGWHETTLIESSAGDVSALLVRGEKALSASYSWPTRTVFINDGRDELKAWLVDGAREDGVIVEGPDGVARIDRDAAVKAGWQEEPLSVTERLVADPDAFRPALPEPVHGLLSGLWPWGSGAPQTDGDWALADRQINLLLARVRELIALPVEDQE